MCQFQEFHEKNKVKAVTKTKSVSPGMVSKSKVSHIVEREPAVTFPRNLRASPLVSPEVIFALCVFPSGCGDVGDPC